LKNIDIIGSNLAVIAILAKALVFDNLPTFYFQAAQEKG